MINAELFITPCLPEYLHKFACHRCAGYHLSTVVPILVNIYLASPKFVSPANKFLKLLIVSNSCRLALSRAYPATRLVTYTGGRATETNKFLLQLFFDGSKKYELPVSGAEETF